MPEPEHGAPIMPGPVFAGTYHTPGDPANSSYHYGRFHNPTWSAFERAVGELEGGTAVVFPSGMAATTAVFETTLSIGDIVVLPADSYYTTRVFAQERLRARGVEVRMGATAGNALAELLDDARLLWLESPTNPQLDVCDIAALAEAAHARGVLVAVDNTTATLLGQQPLALGADISVASDTKALTGHGDLLLGHVAVHDATMIDKLRTYRTQTGAIPGPMEVWLAHRSLGTLDVRLARQCANALTIATFLASRPEVLRVRYPGLPSDPAHAIAAKQMQSFGPVVSFELADRVAAERFFANARLIIEATSFGSLHTLAERRARWGGDAIGEGFVRLSVGCEDAADLIDDLGQALAATVR